MHLCVSVALILGVVVVLILGVVVVLILGVVVGLVLGVVVGLILGVVVGFVLGVVVGLVLGVVVGLVLVRLLVLAGRVTFYTFGRVHLRRVQRTRRSVRKGDETTATGSEPVESLRYGGPLLRRAGGALEAEHGLRGEFQVDGEQGAIDGQTQSSDAMFVGPNRPQPFALDQGRTRRRGG